MIPPNGTDLAFTFQRPRSRPGKKQTRAGENPPRGDAMSKLRNYAWFVVAGGLIATYAVLMFLA